MPEPNPGHAEPELQRRLAAIMFTDMVGYSALSQRNEALAIELLNEHRKILRSIFSKHNGKEIETIGDAFFVEFNSAVEAANCAIEIQESLYERNKTAGTDRHILLRIGLHVGDVIFYEKYVHGDGVNIAARLEPLSPPGGICLSEDIARAIQNKIQYPLVSKGKAKLKNISSPVNIYLVQLPWVINQSHSFLKGSLSHKHSMESWDSKRIATFAVGAVLLSFFIFMLFFNSGKTNATNKRIAVLPFLNISNDTNDEYFADGITEEIISNLAKMSGLDVIARTSVMKYKKTNLNVAQIGSELMVSTILEGSVRKAENKTRITVQLIDVNSQKPLWSEDYDREIKDIFAIQSDIAMKVAEELKVQLQAHEKEQIEKVGTQNTDAYRNYLLGSYFLNKRTGESLVKGLEYYNKATELDPSFAQAYTGLANCYTLLGGAAYGKIPREEASGKAKEAVFKALSIDNTLAEAHTSLGYIKFRLDWEWDEAEKEFKRAIELKPGYAQAHEWYALFLSLIRRSEKALSEMQRAYQLDPLSPTISTGLGRILHFDNKLKAATDQFKKTIVLYPNYGEAYFGLAMSYLGQRKIDDAMKELNRAIELSPGRLVMITTRGMIHGFAGRKKEALATIDELKKLSYPDSLPAWHPASLYLSVGDKDQFFEHANNACDQKDALMVYFKTSSILDPSIEKDPRYHDILKKMNLEN